jgi:hypothetical protein
VLAPNQPRCKDNSIDPYACHAQPSTWQEVLGFHNVYAEWITCAEEGLEVASIKKYFDDYDNYYYMDEPEGGGLHQYFLTGDRRFLMQWWKKHTLTGESINLPIEHFGKEPIYGGVKSA